MQKLICDGRSIIFNSDYKIYIFCALFQPPLSDTNYLYEMNKKVKEITSALIQLVQKGQRKEVEIPGYSPLCINLRNVEMKQLITLSRQYLTYAKMHTPDIENVPQLYIQFLKSQLN